MVSMTEPDAVPTPSRRSTPRRLRRRLLGIAVALSVLLSLFAAAAWVTSYTSPPAWRLLATAHSADLTRVASDSRTAVFATTPNWSKSPNHGFWDAWWVLSDRGELALLAQVIDYDGTLYRVHSAPPSLTIEPQAGMRTVTVFGGVEASARSRRWLGFSLRSDEQSSDSSAPLVTVRAWILTVPWWFLVLPGLPLPLIRLREIRRRGAAGAA